jgi:uncharacterized integral membrane protein
LRAIWLLLKFLMMIGIALVGAFFGMGNDQPMRVNFVLFDGPSVGAGVWLLLFLALGTVLGMLASSLLVFSYRRKLGRIQKKD